MFRNRKLTITLDKKKKDQISETHNPEEFESQAEFVLHKLESLGAKMFLGIVVFVLFDTYRQVTIEKAKYPSN